MILLKIYDSIDFLAARSDGTL